MSFDVSVFKFEIYLNCEHLSGLKLDDCKGTWDTLSFQAKQFAKYWTGSEDTSIDTHIELQRKSHAVFSIR